MRARVVAALGWLGAVLAAAGCAATSPSPLTEPVPPGAPALNAPRAAGFEFHNGFWMNLHHTLFEQGLNRSRKRAEKSPCGRPAPAGPAAQGWESAVEHYRTTYASRDLLFDDGLSAIKTTLAAIDDGAAVTALPPELASVLAAAAPAYRACGWDEHREANARFIGGVTALLNRHGAALERRLAEVYRGTWPDRIRVDVVDYANWSGAYTTLDPVHSVVSSTNPETQGLVALELVFHEASHALIGPNDGAVTLALRDAFKARGASMPRDLWHALLFYSTGEIVRETCEKENLGPYAPMASGAFYERAGWTRFAEALAAHWKPYLEGKSDLGTAARGIAAAL